MWNSRKNMAVVASVLLLCLTMPSDGFPADWKEQERACRAQCPPFPRFSGIETQAEYARRMRLQAAHDRCFMRCARNSAERFSPSFTPVDEAARAYYRRNGVRVPK